MPVFLGLVYAVIDYFYYYKIFGLIFLVRIIAVNTGFDMLGESGG